jgi:glyoxylase-like metal-dependent hydrolase (beta-lactamase superfamily II)
VFQKCKTFIQEADPWEWLGALKRIEALDVETIVPGHGEPCDKGYLKRQAEIIENWIELVEGFVRKGMTEKEVLEEKFDVTRLDPYPIGQRLFEMSERLNKWNLSNVYRHVAARSAGTRVEPRGASIQYYT